MGSLRGGQVSEREQRLARSVLRQQRQSSFSPAGKLDAEKPSDYRVIQQQLSGGSSSESAFNSSWARAGGLSRAPCCVVNPDWPVTSEDKYCGLLR